MTRIYFLIQLFILNFFVFLSNGAFAQVTTDPKAVTFIDKITAIVAGHPQWSVAFGVVILDLLGRYKKTKRAISILGIFSKIAHAVAAFLEVSADFVDKILGNRTE